MTALFDVDPDLIGMPVGGIPVHHIDDIPAICAEREVSIGVIATPPPAAQIGLRPAGRGRRRVHPELRPRRAAGARPRRGPQGGPRRRAAGAVVPRGPRRAEPGPRIDRGWRQSATPERQADGLDGEWWCADERARRRDISHRTTDLRVLEQARAVHRGRAARRSSHELSSDHVSEACWSATCNRLEVYAVVETFHGGLDDVVRGARHAHRADHGGAVRHLLRALRRRSGRPPVPVAAGLDSMVVGETQILGQVRTAYATAREAAPSGARCTS